LLARQERENPGAYRLQGIIVSFTLRPFPSYGGALRDDLDRVNGYCGVGRKPEEIVVRWTGRVARAPRRAGARPQRHRFRVRGFTHANADNPQGSLQCPSSVPAAEHDSNGADQHLPWDARIWRPVPRSRSRPAHAEVVQVERQRRPAGPLALAASWTTPPPGACHCARPSAGSASTVWVPVIRSSHATCAYSWITPPSRSRRTTLPVGRTTGGSAGPSGGACPRRGGDDGGCNDRHTRPAQTAAASIPRSASDQAPSAERSQPTAPRSIRPGCPQRRAQHLDPSAAKTASNAAVNFVSRSRTRHQNQPTRSLRPMSRLRACCVTHSPTGCAVPRARGPGE
jgi:hypothetical protein